MFSGPAAHRDTFEFKGCLGSINVWYGRVPDVADSGLDAVFGTGLAEQDPYRLARLSGFPAILVRVDPLGRGYRNWLGWIQLVRESAPDGSRSAVDVDPIWYLQNTDIPFAAMGYCPTFFDSPSRAEREPLLWEADLYLCSVPMVSDPDLKTDRAVHPLCGVRWGFEIPREGADPDLTYPRKSPNEAWSAHSRLLSAKFPNWTFQP
jgi:hypothetical protein